MGEAGKTPRGQMLYSRSVTLIRCDFSADKWSWIMPQAWRPVRVGAPLSFNAIENGMGHKANSISVLVPITDAAGHPTLTGNRTVAVDLGAFRMFRAPRFTGTITTAYVKAFDSGTFEISGTLYYSGSYSIEPSGRVRQGAYEMLNGRASWTFGGNGIKIGIYGRNLTNRTVLQTTSLTGRGDAGSFQERRNYGVFASYAF